MTNAQVILYGVHRMNGSVRHQRDNSHFIWYHHNRAINFIVSSNAQSQTDRAPVLPLQRSVLRMPSNAVSRPVM
jgi:hypothetical protein